MSDLSKRSLILGVAAAALAMSAPVSHAAIQVGVGGTTQAFGAAPGLTEWATVSIGALSADYSNNATMDAAIATVTAASVNTTLATATGVPTTNALALFNSTGGYLTTAPTGNGATLLLATIQNTTGSTQAGLTVKYDLGLINNNVTTVEEVTPGHRVYFSTTGLAGSFTPIGNFGYNGDATTPATTPKQQSFAINSPIANNGVVYLLFADDNGAVNPDTINTIDNVVITPGVPEPATFGLAGVAAVGLLARRRR